MLYSTVIDGSLTQTYDNSPFDESYDVIVAGLGTAGAIAAILCAQKGLRTLGIESLACMGGTGTAGGITGYYHGSPGGCSQSLDLPLPDGVGDAEEYAKRRTLLEEAVRAEVHLCFEASVTGAFLDADTVHGVEWYDDSGRHTADARIVIDATADAYLARMAGCTLTYGREADGRYQPYSYVFLTASAGRISHWNIDSGVIDPYDAWAYSRDITSTTCDEKHLWEQYDAQNLLLGFVPIIGIREGATVVGEDRVTLEDVTLPRELPVPAFYGYSNVDHHGKDTAYEDAPARDWLGIAGLWGVGIRFGVPCGAAVTKGIAGLLICGRAMSVEHSFAPALRMKDEMQKSGELAAVLARMCVTRGVSPAALIRDSDAVAEVRRELIQTGCLRETDAPGLYDEKRKCPLAWLTDPDAIRAGLSSDAPGLAIWSARRERLTDLLREWVSTPEMLLSCNAALALSLLGDDTGLPVLLRLAEDRSGYIPSMSRKYNPPHAVSAIHALGRLGAVDAVPLLTRIVRDPFWTVDIPFTPNALLDSPETRAFLWFTAAHAALQHIARKHPVLREDITRTLRDVLNADTFRLTVGLKASGLLVDAAPIAREVFRRFSRESV